jgi:hypothetical protein
MNPTLPPAAKRGLAALAGLAAVLAAAGILMGWPGAWGAFQMSFFMLMGLGAGALLFLSMNFAAGGRWTTQFRRVPEAMAATLSVTGALVLVLLGGAVGHYPWARPEVQGLASMAGKNAYFKPLFYDVRSLVYVAGWILFSRLILAQSRRQDQDGLLSRTALNRKLGIGFIIFFAYSFSLASVDWIGSLEPTWFSTIFGLYCFAGAFQSVFAAIILLVLYLEKKGVYQGLIRDEHLHDLAKFMFAFSAFWAYMWFSQYMLTWYADLPDENQYYLLRGGAWAYMIALTVLGRFLVPFVVLGSQAAKRNRRVLGGMAALVLVTHWLDLLVMIMPSQWPGLGALPLLVLIPAGAAAGFLLLFFGAFGRQAAVPQKDPGLAFSQHYHI